MYSRRVRLSASCSEGKSLRRRPLFHGHHPPQKCDDDGGRSDPETVVIMYITRVKPPATMTLPAFSP